MKSEGLRKAEGEGEGDVRGLLLECAEVGALGRRERRLRPKSCARRNIPREEILQMARKVLHGRLDGTAIVVLKASVDRGEELEALYVEVELVEIWRRESVLQAHRFEPLTRFQDNDLHLLHLLR